MRTKTRALRRRVWFKVTSRLERGIVDLTIRCVERIRSPVLVRIVSGVVERILETLDNDFLERVKKIGGEIADTACRIALSWGNMSASAWKSDPDFIGFLGVNAVNTRTCQVCLKC